MRLHRPACGLGLGVARFSVRKPERNRLESASGDTMVSVPTSDTGTYLFRTRSELGFIILALDNNKGVFC